MCEEEKLDDFIKGEFRKVYMDVTDDCDNKCDDFIVQNTTAYLLKSGKRIDLKSELDVSGKRLTIDIDCSELEGFYKLVVEYAINDELLFASTSMRVRKL